MEKVTLEIQLWESPAPHVLNLSVVLASRLDRDSFLFLKSEISSGERRSLSFAHKFPLPSYPSQNNFRSKFSRENYANNRNELMMTGLFLPSSNSKPDPCLKIQPWERDFFFGFGSFNPSASERVPLSFLPSIPLPNIWYWVITRFFTKSILFNITFIQYHPKV